MIDRISKTFRFIKADYDYQGMMGFGHEVGFPKPIHRKKNKNLKKRHQVSKFKASKKRLPTLRSLIKKADVVFSKFIRARDGNQCVICGSKKNVQCGHLFKRGKHSLRYDQFNCNALCSYHNYLDNFEPQHYISWFAKKYGWEKYDELYVISRRIKKFTRDELLQIIQKYEKTH